jgi:hypothetical protein
MTPPGANKYSGVIRADNLLAPATAPPGAAGILSVTADGPAALTETPP